MFKFFVAALVAACTSFYCEAQNETPLTKKYNHYVGFQANELLRQLLNLSDNDNAVDNPYIVTYSIESIRSRLGLHIGFGYTYNRVSHKDAPVSSETKVNDLFYRIGFLKKVGLGKRFEAGLALDLIGGYQLDKTFTSSVTPQGSTIDTSNTSITNKIITYGGGPQLSLGFYITEKIILGTEASMYYSMKRNTQNILVKNISTDIFNGGDPIITTSNFNDEVDTYGFAITLPVSIFLIVKF